VFSVEHARGNRNKYMSLNNNLTVKDVLGRMRPRGSKQVEHSDTVPEPAGVLVSRGPRGSKRQDTKRSSGSPICVLGSKGPRGSKQRCAGRCVALPFRVLGSIGPRGSQHESSLVPKHEPDVFSARGGRGDRNW